MSRTRQQIQTENDELQRLKEFSQRTALLRQQQAALSASDDSFDASRAARIDEHIRKREELIPQLEQKLKDMQRVSGYDRFVSSMMEIIELCKLNAELLNTYDPMHNVVLLAVNPFRWNELVSDEIKQAYEAYQSKKLPANCALEVQKKAFDKTQVDHNGNVSFVNREELESGQLLPGLDTIPEGAKSEIINYSHQSIVALQMAYLASEGYNVSPIHPNTVLDPMQPCHVTDQNGNAMTTADLDRCKRMFSRYIKQKSLNIDIKEEPVTPGLRP